MVVGCSDAAWTRPTTLSTSPTAATVPATRRRHSSSCPSSRKTATYSRLMPARNARPRPVSAGFTLMGSQLRMERRAMSLRMANEPGLSRASSRGGSGTSWKRTRACRARRSRPPGSRATSRPRARARRARKKARRPAAADRRRRGTKAGSCTAPRASGAAASMARTVQRRTEPDRSRGSDQVSGSPAGNGLQGDHLAAGPVPDAAVGPSIGVGVDALLRHPAVLPLLPAVDPPVAVRVQLHPSDPSPHQLLRPVRAPVAVLVVLLAARLPVRPPEDPHVGPLAPPGGADLDQLPVRVVVLPAVDEAVEVLVDLQQAGMALAVVVVELVGAPVAVAVVLDPLQAPGGVVEGLVGPAVQQEVLAAVGRLHQRRPLGGQAAPGAALPCAAPGQQGQQPRQGAPGGVHAREGSTSPSRSRRRRSGRARAPGGPGPWRRAGRWPRRGAPCRRRGPRSWTTPRRTGRRSGPGAA